MNNLCNPTALENRVVFISGAGSGIGRATAVKLTEAGASVYSLDISEEGLNATADLAKDGKITLKVNGNEVAAGKCPGPLNQIPADGLEVGRDDVAAVGDYKGPNAFTGKIKKVVIELGK